MEENGGLAAKLKRTAVTLLLCLAIAAVSITVVSKCSFLYRFNDWADVNWFLSMGHGIVDGKVPYKDLFEQKGVLIYMIFALAYLMDNGGYLGVYLIEILFAAAYLFIAYRIMSLYKGRFFCHIALVPVALLTYCSAAFALGGGAVEEYCLPLLAYGLFVFLRSMQSGGKIPVVSVILCGVCSGLIFWIKYTMLAFYFAFAVCVFVERCIRHKVGTGFLYAALFIAGFAAACVPWFVYMAVNSALGDLWNVYFIDNIFSYAGSKGFAQVAHDFGNTVVNLLKNILLYICALLAMGYILSLRTVARRFKVCHICIFAVLFIVQCIVYGSHLYYHLAVAIYVPLGVAGADRCLNGLMAKAKQNRSKKRVKKAQKSGLESAGALTFIQSFDYYSRGSELAGGRFQTFFARVKVKFIAVYVAAFLVILLLCGNCTLELFRTKSYYPQVNIAGRIEDEAQGDDYTLICYKIRDDGFYTACGVSPDYYYFALNNFTREAFPELYDGQESYVKDGGADYVITYLSIWQEEEDGILCNYRELDEGRVYSYTHCENNFQWEHKDYVLLVAVR